jgi:ADP-heptose:LPS heptosyltransferase
MKILIIRFSSIGDIVLTTPVIRTLKTQLNEAEVHYVTKPGYAGILENNPYVDKVHVLEGSLSNLIGKLKQEKYDFVADLHQNVRSRTIRTSLGRKSCSVNKINLEKWLMVNLKVNRLPSVHIVDRYMETISELGVKMDELGLDYFIPEKDEVEREWLPETHRKEFVAFAIGGQHATKKLPFKRMIELCDRINKPIILLGGKEDQEVGEQIEQFFKRNDDDAETEEKLHVGLNKKAIIFNGCGKFNLNQSASLVKQSQAVFTHDTGLMHIAAAFKKQVFSIWGNTIPAFGMYPYRTKFTVFENNNVGCRPCSKIGFQKCPKGHFKCMNDIVFDFYLP